MLRLSCSFPWRVSLIFFLIVPQIVRPIPDTNEKQGNTIKSGTIIRLQHMRTRRWLHSHLHASPITGNMEVSELDCYYHYYYNLSPIRYPCSFSVLYLHGFTQGSARWFLISNLWVLYMLPCWYHFVEDFSHFMKCRC